MNLLAYFENKSVCFQQIQITPIPAQLPRQNIHQQKSNLCCGWQSCAMTEKYEKFEYKQIIIELLVI